MSNGTQRNSFYDSDSFESDTDSIKKRVSRKTATSQPSYMKTEKKFKAYTQNSIAAKNRQRNNNRKVTQQKRFSATELEVTAQRILSARKHQIANQTNTIQELQKEIENLQTENKTLKTQTHRQGKALQKIDSKQSDLPRILEQHQSELQSMKEQMRRTKDILSNEIRQRKDCDSEIIRLRNALSKATQLVSDKNLGERSSLQMQLIAAQEKLDISEKSLEATNRHLENLEKSHKREIYNLKKQLKQYENQNNDLEKELDQLKINLKEKEKLLEIQNIYSHRIKIPHRLPNASNEPGICGVCSGLNNDQLLDKLHFNHSSTKESSFTKSAHQSNSADDSPNLTYLDPEKIKEDIRKIIEEEIMSGRIKPVEYHSEGHSPIISSRISNEHRSPGKGSPLPESSSTSTVMGSEIFDKDPPTQIQSLVEEVQNTEEIHNHIEQDFKRKEILIEKLKSIDTQKPAVEQVEKSNLQYSYPNDEDYVNNDPSISEIETISASETKVSTKPYVFNNAIEHLHQGIPVHLNNTDQNFKRRIYEKKKISSNKTESNNLQIDVALSQKNNSNIDQAYEESLPPLSEQEHQSKERELMAELFGQYQPSSSLKSRSGSLPWDSNEKVKSKFENSPTSIRLVDLGKSEELEEIML